MSRMISALCAALFLTACGERASDNGEAPPERAAPAPVALAASDEIVGLAAAPTGVDFWVHPNVAFNSLVIVAGADGLTSYNIEDGAEVSRAPGVSLTGVAASYIGTGPLAAGVVASFDASAGAFRMFGIDNGSRLFLPLDGGPEIRGAVRGFCMGRADGAVDPSLFVIQKSAVRIFNLAPAIANGVAGVDVAGETTIDAPETVSTCAVDAAGVVWVAASGGRIYKLAASSPFESPTAQIDAATIGALRFVGSTSDAGDNAGWIAAFDADAGHVALIDADDGHDLGAIALTPGFESAASDVAVAMGASGANLGGLYRDGAIAIGLGGDAPGVRLAPVSGVANALTLETPRTAPPRGVNAPSGDGGASQTGGDFTVPPPDFDAGAPDEN